MFKVDFSKRLSFWLQLILLVGIVAGGVYFLVDPATPKILKLLITFIILGFVLFFFIGGGGGKGGPLGGKAPPERFGGH